MKRWLVRAMAMAVLALLAGASPALARSAFKVGLDERQLSGAAYTHDNGTTKLENSDLLVATQLTLEFLPTESFGLEVAYALSPLQRNYQLGANGATSSNVLEEASYVLYGANYYLFRDDRQGLHPLIGVATGTIGVTQKFEGGTLGSTSTAATVNVNVLKLGMEWVGEKAGLRLIYESWSGQSSNATKLAGIRQTNNYTGTSIVLGVFING